MGIVDSLLLDLLEYFRAIGVFYSILLAFLIIVVVSVGYGLRRLLSIKRGRNPFSLKHIRPREPLVVDKDKRDAVLKHRFLTTRVPDNLDVIIIGSGIGGLSCAALLSKAGHRVLVLEQHDQAGGCCHTFIEKGFEFDVGIHYVGEMDGDTLSHTYVNQITDGQLGWAPTNDVIDRVQLCTNDGERSTHDVIKGRHAWKHELQRTFPDENEAIEKYFEAMMMVRKSYHHSFMLKIMPLWLSRLFIRTGLLGLFSGFPIAARKSLRQFLDEITTNETLKAVLSYSFGDYGTPPAESPMFMQLLLMNHYTHGGYYPIGGASEIAFNIIPVIRRSGGDVLVNARVVDIITENGKATGVNVDRKGEKVPIFAPVIVSAAGIMNTFKTLLHSSVTSENYMQGVLSKVSPGYAAISVFIGLEGTAKELGLQSINTWAFKDINFDRSLKEFLSLPVNEVGLSDIPLLFISFPSSKDPTWEERRPGKSCCTVITLANWEWFKDWKDTRLNKRGMEYEKLKKRIEDRCWQQVLQYYPQLEGKVVYMEVGTPVTNNYYLNSTRGEIYGLNHSLSRFDVDIISRLRATTSVPGLYLTGQDISTAGFTGALYAGLFTTSAILNRNLFNDLKKINGKIKESKIE